MENTTNINADGTQQKAAVKYCTTCGESLNPMAEICPKCGVRQAIPAAPAPAVQPAPNVKYCTTCGASLNLAAEICPKCGVRQTAASPNMLSVSGGGSSRSMGFFESWATCISKAFDFKGRASQSEFAYFTLSQYGIFFLLAFFPILGAILITIIGLILLIPSLAVGVRRFHDFDMSGSVFIIIYIIMTIISIPLAFFLPLCIGISLIVDVIIACIKGTEGANRYGA